MDVIDRKHQTSSDDSPITFIDDIIEEMRNITKNVSLFSMIWDISIIIFYSVNANFQYFAMS